MWNARKYIKIDTFYASSQLCSVCGYQNPDTKDLSVRTWICPKCGAEHDKTTRLMLKLEFDGVIDMKIREVNENKKQFIALLLLADELHHAEIYVHEDDCTKQIDGFIGLNDDYIEGVFVKETMQSKGIGKQLLNHAKEFRLKLKLSVYQENEKAIKFYLREKLAYFVPVNTT
jgi:GNAT superfamily N-acetyltransferase